MDPQKRFLASTLQGAIDADVVTQQDLYRHLSAEVLAEYVPPELLWAALSEGMREAGLGFGAPMPRPRETPTPAPRPAASIAKAPPASVAQARPSVVKAPAPVVKAPPPPTQTPTVVPPSKDGPEEPLEGGAPEFDDADLDAAFEQATDGASTDDGFGFAVGAGELPPIPEGEALVIDDFDDDDR